MTSRAHKIRLYPNKAQEAILAKTVGTARYAYNWGLDLCEAMYKNGEKHPSGYDLRRMWVTNHPEWADEVAASCIYKSFLNVDAAYKAFFYKRTKHPRHHKKGIHDSFYVAADKSNVRGNKVRVPGVGYIRMAEKLRYEECSIKSYVFSRKAGQWFVSIQVEILDEVRTESTSVVGIDVGIKNWAAVSDGTVCIATEKLKYYERQLKHKQQNLARKKKGSKRREKAKLAVQKAYKKITDVKLDTIHKFTSAVAKNHGTAVIEDLNIKAMQESDNKGIRKGVHDSAMAEIHRQLMYKCSNYVKVEKYYASSKTCSKCGNVKDSLTLGMRMYHCDVCHTVLDRDLNAALNLRNRGLAIISDGSHR